MQIYKIISKLVSIITFIFINKEVLGGVLSASQRVLLILPCLTDWGISIIHRPVLVP